VLGLLVVILSFVYFLFIIVWLSVPVQSTEMICYVFSGLLNSTH